MEIQSVTYQNIAEGEHIDSISSMLIQIAYDDETPIPKKQFRAIHNVEIPEPTETESSLEEKKALDVIAALKRAKYKKMSVVVSAPTLESAYVFAKTASVLGFKVLGKELKTPANLIPVETALKEAHDGIKKKYTDDRWIW
jgi:hypothetical protein